MRAVGKEIGSTEMTLCKRIVARLDIKGSRLIKGVRFEGLRVIGDPVSAAQLYSRSGIDELLYIDAVASLYGRNSLSELIKEASKEVFVPLTVGGGIRSTEDARQLLANGADKIAVNTACFAKPSLITEIAEAFGKQCVVGSVQARKIGPMRWEAMAESGREKTGRDVLEWIKELENRGAGEILVTSVDQDGTLGGPDYELISAVSEIANVPLIVGGGFSTVEHVNEALNVPNISGVSIGAAVHKGLLNVSPLKDELRTSSSNFPVRYNPIGSDYKELSDLGLSKGKRIGVIDYGMGNQQSLLNAIAKIGGDGILSSKCEKLKECDVLLLPGVGAFGQGMSELKTRGLDAFIREWCMKKKPLVGICLGMQMLFESSEEFGRHEGLGLIGGTVKSLRDISTREELKLPHMGWNRLLTNSKEIWNEKLYQESDQYFVHSFGVDDIDDKNVVHRVGYMGQLFIATVSKDSIVGFQFHPEKSGIDGLRLLSRTLDVLLRH